MSRECGNTGTAVGDVEAGRLETTQTVHLMEGVGVSELISVFYSYTAIEIVAFFSFLCILISKSFYSLVLYDATLLSPFGTAITK